MTVVLPIAKIDTDNSILRRIAEPVDKISSKETQNLIDNLMHTCDDAGGMGIAAPQVFHSKQIFIMSSHPNKRYPNAPVMEPIAVVNPKIIWKSEKLEKDWEGCLSVPGLRGLVPRSESIKVTYTNRYNEYIETKFHGFLARIFQHEFDHLNGTLFVDIVQSAPDIVTDKQYEELMNNRS
jgi:peptide deformylase